MSQRIRNALEYLVYVFAWLILAILAILTGFQIHATLTASALAMVKNSALRPSGWSTQTIYGLSRLLWVILGILWLVWVMYTQEYLSEGKQLQILKNRIIRLLMLLGVIYSISYVILLLL